MCFRKNFLRSEIIDWTTITQNPDSLEELGVNPDLILATDVVFDGSPYDHFVKVCESLAVINNSVTVLVIMPSKKDRKQSEHFLELMA